MSQISKACCLLGAALLLGGCGAIEFAYDNAPSLVASEIDDAFDLTDEQGMQVDAGLQRFFAWHRQRELPLYRELLGDAALKIADGISAGELLEFGDGVRAAWQRSLERAIDELGELAPTLTPQQVANYEEYFRDRSEKYVDYLEMSLQQREIDRVKRNMKRLESWFGKFDEFQEERIRERLQRLPDLRPAWISFRAARQQALLQALRAAPQQGLSRQQLKSILLEYESEYAVAYEKARSDYWQAYAVAIEEIGRGLSQAQLRHAVERLHYFAEIVDEISADD